MSEHRYGPFVRLWGILRSQLPPEGASSQELTTFIAPILTEAVSFVNTVPPATAPDISIGPWKPKGSKTFPHSAAPVHLYERVVPAADLDAVVREHHVPQMKGHKPRAESWILRRSVHDDAAKKGTAAWEEWTRYFKDGHAEAEKLFTPAVLSTELLTVWDCGGVEVVLGNTRWSSVTLRLEQSVHKLPAPLMNRVFPVLQITAAAEGKRIILVVQIAVGGMQQGHGHGQGQGQSREATAEEAGMHHIGDKALKGAYTSIEVFVSQPDLGGVEWIMGTVSDAGGVLPAWVQKMAVPGRIAKDVDMFLDWVDKERQKTNGE